AADLIAQAEHDPEAVPSLVACSNDFVDEVRSAVLQQLETLPTRETARAAFENSFSVVVSDREEAVEVCDRVAPEHLQVMVEDAASFAARLTNYGGLFVGSKSAEVFGDYGVGPNHVLPTGGTGRFSGGLSVKDFLVTRTWMELDDPTEVIEDTARLARLEGLEGHARAAEKGR
ncbi:MAG: histidinol dehydrogenase, partial [Halobacteriales archaeon]|nr:histidinol dehydrogenase [Halobacteriales archaeon]